jgi:hypothetical protein
VKHSGFGAEIILHIHDEHGRIPRIYADGRRLGFDRYLPDSCH